MNTNVCSEEKVFSTLERIQRWYQKDGLFFVTEDRDWLVILQWLQDHELFKTNSERPPFAEFAKWVSDNVPLYLTDCSRPAMSVAYKALNGARYPWKNTQMNPSILVRWRVMYRILDKLWEDVSSTRSLHENTCSLHETPFSE